MARKLASIQKISDIKPIPDKDRIVLATVCGWQVIVQKDQFDIGDLCVFCEIDSVLPEKPEFEFLRKNNFRIKTMKMANTISQGICFPLSILPEKNWKENDDVTNVIGVTQYERTMDIEENTMLNSNSSKHKIPKFLKSLMRYKIFNKLLKWIFLYKFGTLQNKNTDFPDEVHKTNEVRIQSAPNFLELDKTWTVTEKVEGCSATFLLRRTKMKKFVFPWSKKIFKYEYIVCSRNKAIPVKDNSVYWQISDKYNIKQVLLDIMPKIGADAWVAIQGECVGPKIQGNIYKLSEPDFFVFNVITPYTELASSAVRCIIENQGLKWVPVIDEHFKTPDTVDDMLSYAHGYSIINPDTLREGVVVRDNIDTNVSFKAVDPIYLMKYDN